MCRSPVLALFGFALLCFAALGPSCDSSKCCYLPPSDAGGTSRPCASNLFTACVHACGETASSESTAATCANGIYTCNDATFPAVGCPQSGWSAALPCGPWVSGYDCGAQCAVCDQGLWTCGACPDAATD
ncbi:MAG TPA: hypothetical protein VN962_14785 [Polyangia bacterium]|nr:hypothetical protein [Polyangia bacterium]